MFVRFSNCTKIFSAGELANIDSQCRIAGIGCVDCKKKLAENMAEAMSDIHTRRAQWAAKPAEVKEILANGAERARKLASVTMEQVRAVMHLA